MDINGMLLELGCDTNKTEDINSKSTVLVEIFQFCEKIKIVIQDDAKIERDGNKLTFFPTGKNQGHYISVELDGGKIQEILEKQAA